MKWLTDWTCLGYILIVTMCLWNIGLCVEYHIEKKRLSPFFYYVVLMMVGIGLSSGYELHSRLSSGILGIQTDPCEQHAALISHLKTIWWALRLSPEIIALSFITVDFWLRRFKGKRLFSKLYPDPIVMRSNR